MFEQSRTTRVYVTNDGELVGGIISPEMMQILDEVLADREAGEVAAERLAAIRSGEMMPRRGGKHQVGEQRICPTRVSIPVLERVSICSVGLVRISSSSPCKAPVRMLLSRNGGFGNDDARGG